jgi:hypothetical protein
LACSLARELQIDPDLACVIRAWPALPSHIKVAVVALVRTAKSYSSRRDHPSEPLEMHGSRLPGRKTN